MENLKFLYFRTVADEANDDGLSGTSVGASVTSAVFPASSLVSIAPTTDTAITMYFNNMRSNRDEGNGGGGLHDSVLINVDQGKTFEVMSDILAAVNAHPNSDGFITIADDLTTTDSATSALADLAVQPSYISGSINSCGGITVMNADAGYGVHEYYEVVGITAAATADDDVLDPLSMYIPAQAMIVEAAIIAVELSTDAQASCALEVHTSAQVHNAGSGGTEIVGADQAGNLSEPDEDLNFGSGDVLGDSVAGGEFISHESPLDRGTSVSHFALCAKESGMSNSGTAKIGVYLKWYGPAAVAL